MTMLTSPAESDPARRPGPQKTRRRRTMAGLSAGRDKPGNLAESTAASAPATATSAPSASALAHAAENPWQRRFARNIAITDCIAIAATVPLAHLLRFGFTGNHDVTRLLISFVLAGAWMIALGTTKSRDLMVIGSGFDEFRRVRNASLVPFVLYAVTELWLKADFARSYVLLTMAIGYLLINIGRYTWRRVLAHHRSAGQHVLKTIVLGADSATVELAESLAGDHHVGIEIIGACIPGYRGVTPNHLQLANTTIPILGDDTELRAAIDATGADVVAVTATEALGSGRLKELSWELHDADVRLILAPGLLDIADNRVRTSTTSGTTLVHVDHPRYRNSASLIKSVGDRMIAAGLLLFLAPVLLAIALAVKLTSRGPVFYTANRVGAGGEAFPMMKFRSMRQNADALKADLADQNEAAGPLFKMRDDPRITGVGAVMRRYSLDELPQLFNVLTGDMSLVGPRPHLADEVAMYSTDAQRRMLVKPGLTGLWQVSGRSNLTWEQSLRLDLNYVENWSILLDTYILLKTFKAVFTHDGAY